MNALEYLRAKGREHCKEVALRAGTTLGYFEQIAYGFRRPSVSLARAFERETAGDLIATELVFAPRREESADTHKGTQ